MRRNIDFWVKCFKFQKEKGLSAEEAWNKIIEPLLKPPTIKQIQSGSFEYRPKQTSAFAKIAKEHVYEGKPIPYSKPEDVVDEEKDTELKKLEAEKLSFEKDDKIKKLKEELEKLKAKKTDGKSEKRTVQKQE